VIISAGVFCEVNRPLRQKKFLSIFILSLLAFLVIFNIVDLIEKLDKFLKNQMSVSLIARFLPYQLPYYLNVALPESLLLAAVFTIGLLAKHNELAANKSSGISLYRFRSRFC
jgi:lipopolysaccharide export system permease protein